MVVALKPLLRSMNSYYTNKIEGEHTRPADIDRALAKQFSRERKEARAQRLAVAHIQAEQQLESEFAGLGIAELYTPDVVQRIHAVLFGKLPAAERMPHGWRTTDVTAGRHVAPPASEVPELVEAWAARYAKLPGIELGVVGVACSHHRLLWVHPFPDGNGRAARLHSLLALRSLGLTHGVWSPLRGMARDQENYYARLNNADLSRRNDLDGRGPLSQEELVAFARWFLDVCIDQASFMRGLLGLEQLKHRLQDLLLWLDAHPWRIGSEPSAVKADALEALHYVALTGPLDRARFMAMTGLPLRTARRVLASLLDYGVLTTAGPRAPVSFAVPQASLRFLFPRLWPEAEADGV